MNSGSQWIEYRFLPTPIIPKQLENGCSFVVLLLDVHNKIWFGHTINIADTQFQDIFTYHMLNENTLVVVEFSQFNLVQQHVINVDLKTRTAEFIQTKFHVFLNREISDPIIQVRAPQPHVLIMVNKKYYTALVNPNSVHSLGREPIYLVPRNPSGDTEPMEFSFSNTLTEAIIGRLVELTETSGHRFEFAKFSTAGLLYFAAFALTESEAESVLLGLYITLDVSKLVDIHNKPMDDVDWIILDDQQDTSTDLIFRRLQAVPANTGYLYVYKGEHALLRPSSLSDFNMCHLLESKKLLNIKVSSDSWLNLHPCGAVLQFKMSPVERRLFVKVVSHWMNTLFSILASKLIFHTNRPIDDIEGLHRIVYHDIKPIPLDKKAKKALGTYEKYAKMMGFETKKDIRYVLDLQAKCFLYSLAFGLPIIYAPIIHFWLYFLKNYLEPIIFD